MGIVVVVAVVYIFPLGKLKFIFIFTGPAADCHIARQAGAKNMEYSYSIETKTKNMSTRSRMFLVFAFAAQNRQKKTQYEKKNPMSVVHHIYAYLICTSSQRHTGISGRDFPNEPVENRSIYDIFCSMHLSTY